MDCCVESEPECCLWSALPRLIEDWVAPTAEKVLTRLVKLRCGKKGFASQPSTEKLPSLCYSMSHSLWVGSSSENEVLEVRTAVDCGTVAELTEVADEAAVVVIVAFVAVLGVG